MCVFKHELFSGSCRGEPGGEPQRREEDGERAHAQHAAGRPHSTAAGRQEVSLDHIHHIPQFVCYYYYISGSSVLFIIIDI